MITKSDYTNFIKCPVLYYLRKFHKELEAPKDIKTDTIISNGLAIGKLAQKYFKDNYIVDRENKSLEEASELTQTAIKNGHKIISEASFIYKDLFCAIDILKINDDKTVTIYEVKSSKNLKDINYDDASFQSYVLKELGYVVKDVYLMHPNADYVFKDKLDIKEFFAFEDVVENSDVLQNINKIRGIKTLPDVIASTHCKKCGFFKSSCYKDLGSPNVFDIANVHSFDLYNKGIRSFEDFLNSPSAKKKKVTITKAVRQCNFELNDLPIYADKVKLQEYIDTKLIYPLYYLDFETVEDTIPFINGTGPSFVRVMQFSVHIKDTPTSKVRHEEYLQESKYDNLEEVADKLIEYLGDKGAILVYSGYEATQIKNLQKLVPSKAALLGKILERLEDMEKPFKLGYVYAKGFKGRTTIKYVLPALCPRFETAYAELPMVHNGSQIDDAYDKLINSTGAEHEQIKDAMLKYCCLDTLAEVEIIDKLYELAK